MSTTFEAQDGKIRLTIWQAMLLLIAKCNGTAQGWNSPVTSMRHAW